MSIVKTLLAPVRIGGICLFASFMLVVALDASAQDRRDRCGDYAADAVQQYKKNRKLDCGYDGPRWSKNRAAHFGWCMIFPRQAREEHETRRELLKECRQSRRDRDRAGKRASCDTYAKLAIVQARANRKYECGYRGGEWRAKERAHFRWCMRARRKYLIDELRYRAVQLQKCFNKLGDYDEGDHDDYYKRRKFR